MSVDVKEGALQDVHGRVYNTASVTYNLPSDAVEWKRLDIQHNALTLAFGGLYPLPQLVEETLGSIQGDGPLRILDVGCGSGIWAFETAIRFPHAQVLGIDISPVPLASSAPPNLTFIQEDVNHGLSAHFDQFHLVQFRCFNGGIHDMPITFRNIARCVKPGGLLVVIGPDYPTDETCQHYLKMAWVEGDEDVGSVSREGSWVQRMVYESNEGSRLTGSRYALEMGWIDGACWKLDLLDRENTISGNLRLPVGEWGEGSDAEETQLVHHVGSLFQQNLLSAARAWGPLLVRNGIDKDLVEDWTRKAEQEVRTTTPRMTFRFQFSLAQRKREEGSTLPGLPTVHPVLQWTASEIYHDRKLEVAHMEKSRQFISELPTSMTARALEKRKENIQGSSA